MRSETTVMTGRSALRKACRRVTSRSGRPLARAVTTKSCDSTSNIDARV